MGRDGIALTDEHVRILYAVENGEMFVNRHGRYEIEGQERPDRKSREQLVKRGLIAWYYTEARNRSPWRLTAKGNAAVQAARNYRVARFVAERDRLVADGMEFPDAHLKAAEVLDGAF